jgi:hypothetical protein
VVYFGSVERDARFDPEMLSGFVVQVKNKTAGATPAEAKLQSMGIPRDLDQPLPYLALLMELGNETLYDATQSKLNVALPESENSDGQFRARAEAFSQAVTNLAKYKKGTSPDKKKLKQEVIDKREAMDNINRYSIFVRGASSDVYGILTEAEINDEFRTLLHITMPSPTSQCSAIQHMRPMERLDDVSHHMEWMSDFS